MANEHVINNNLIITGSVTSSVGFAGDGSGLTGITATAEWDGSRDGDSSITGSLIISGSGANVDLLNAEAGVSGSFSGSFEGDGSGLTGLNINGAQASGSTLSGSFSGSFQGDGSGLTGLNNFPFSGDGIISGSLVVSGSNADFTLATGVSGSFSGSFVGDGSGLTNLPTQEWDGSRDGDSSITGSLVVSGSGITVELKGDTTLDENIFISNTGDSTSIGIGSGSLEETTQSRYTIAIGLQAGNLLVSGSSNVYIGNEAGETATQTVGDTAVGYQALQATTGPDTGDGANESCNTAVGFQALKANTTGKQGTAIGADALRNNTEGLCNTAVGHAAGCNITTGDKNITIGDESGLCVTTQDSNTLIGNCSGYRIESSDNVSLGKDAMRGDGDITGGTNTALGARAGECLTGASTGNVYVGFRAGPSASTTESNQLYINNAAGANPLIKGDFSTCQVKFTGGVTASSFTGSFVGDGSGITGLTTTPSAAFKIFTTDTGANSIKPFTGSNCSTDIFSNILGGNNNCSAGDYSLVGGGLQNTASANYSAIGAGYNNYINISAVSSSIVGGSNNITNLGNTHIIGSNITADKADYSYMNNLDVEGTISASLFSGSFVGDGTGLTGITSLLPSGVVSSSLQFNSISTPFTGSFTGSFTGDGSGLTSVSASSVTFADITNKPTLISSSAQLTSIDAPFTGSFTGSYVGDGSGLTGIVAGADTQVQFNSSSNFGASNGFTFTNDDTLTLGNTSVGNSNGQIHLKEEDNATTAVLVNGNSSFCLYRADTTSRLQHSASIWSFEGTTDSTSTTTGAVLLKGGLGVAGNVNVGGTITAREVVTNIVSQSISFASGSNIFGDELTDIHQFTGSLSITGSILGDLSASGTVSGVTGSFDGGLTANGFVILSQVSESLNFADDTAAASGGVPLGGLYRSGNFIAIRLT
jgi:hypothetical protein